MPRGIPKAKKVKGQIHNDLAGLVMGLALAGGGAGAPNKTPNSINELEMLRNNTRRKLITVDPWLLSYLYNEFGIIQAIIDRPLHDAFKGGFRIAAYEHEVVSEPEKQRGKSLMGLLKGVMGKFGIGNEGGDNKPKLPADDKMSKIDVNEKIRLLDERKKAEEQNAKLDEPINKAEDRIFRKEVDPIDIRCFLDNFVI
jgi:hypothetical protein